MDWRYPIGSVTIIPKKVMQIMRLPFNARFKETKADIEVRHYNYDAFSNAGVLAHGFRYLGSH